MAKEKSAVVTPSEHNPYRKELDDMLHDLNVLESIKQLYSQLRLRYEVKLLFCSGAGFTKYVMTCYKIILLRKVSFG